MSYVRIRKNGYAVFDDGNNHLFSYKTHTFLLDYAAKDLSLISELLKQHITERMNTTTFELIDNSFNDDHIQKAIAKLKSIHPYYKYKYKEVIIKAIGNYFNRLLLYLKKFDVKKDWYFQRLKSLVKSPLLQCEMYYNDFYEMYYNDFYEYYQRSAGEDSELIAQVNLDEYVIDEWVAINIPSKMPKVFEEEIQTHQIVCEMLSFVLDISVLKLKVLSASQRMWLYSNLFHTDFDSSSYIDKQVLFHDSTTHGRKTYNKIIAMNFKRQDVFNWLSGSTDKDAQSGEISSQLNDEINSAIRYAQKMAIDNSFEKYEFKNLRQLLFLEITLMIQSGTKIRKCKQCKKYFVVQNRNTLYCNRPYPKKTSKSRCCDIGSKECFKKKIEEDEPLRIYLTAYRRRNARWNRSQSRVENEDNERKYKDFEMVNWGAEAKEMLRLIRAGKISMEEYMDWFKNNY